MKDMAVTIFKAHALEIIDKISKNQDEVVITKHNKPIARLVPFRGSNSKAVLGRLSNTLVKTGDIVSPLGEKMWNASK